ncbi:MAG TPA: MogA/MoaB family molybdenum cofactor biosynthesis protein [Candidatus Baltobacteraceae bacterium]|jgi:molybdenum cofactor synthesis domain-containing protein|nr:MogA/MoaB family molybdenum cofactor biosynthesis protein [Candidatus Baltobacteraceae bacterium]
MRVAVLTISDSVARDERIDLSGPAVVQRCRELGWEVTSSLKCSDDPGQVRSHLRQLADSRRVDLILTTGGTGLGPRDNTPEATLDIAEKVIPGLAEEMRRKGAELTPNAILSRGVAVVRNLSLILNLPGSPKGAVESLDTLAQLLPHALQVLHGARHD